MKLIEANEEHIEAIGNQLMDSYTEKFSEELLTDKLKDFYTSARNDVENRLCIISEDLSCRIVLLDMTDILLKNSTYYLITRIYVKPEYRGKGLAKQLIAHCQSAYGPLMGYDGKFMQIGDIK